MEAWLIAVISVAVIVLFFLLVILSVKLYVTVTKGKFTGTERMEGKTVIITGANTGLGYESALEMARRGARVLLACRSPAKANEARDKIIATTGNQDVHVRLVDMGSLQSVRDCANEILASEGRIDVLVNNAGATGLGDKKTKDGLHPSLQCNHFGPFLLTSMLLGRLKESAPSRVVFVASKLYIMAKLDVNDLNQEKWKSHDESATYGNTKLLNILISNELARKMTGTGVTSNSLHPGVVKTDILRESPVLTAVLVGLFGTFFKTTKEGAQTQIYLSVDKAVGSVTGKYFEDCHVVKLSGKPADAELARKSWEVSERIVQLKDSERHY